MYKTAYLFFDRSREALCEIGSEMAKMAVRTIDTVNSRIADPVITGTPAIRTAAQSLPIALRTLTRGHEGDLNIES